MLSHKPNYRFVFEFSFNCLNVHVCSAKMSQKEGLHNALLMSVLHVSQHVLFILLLYCGHIIVFFMFQQIFTFFHVLMYYKSNDFNCIPSWFFDVSQDTSLHFQTVSMLVFMSVLHLNATCALICTHILQRNPHLETVMFHF